MQSHIAEAIEAAYELLSKECQGIAASQKAFYMSRFKKIFHGLSIEYPAETQQVLNRLSFERFSPPAHRM